MHPTAEELRQLYCDNQLTARAIGKQFGVSKTSVLRWLKVAGIERRAVGRGLVHRGQTPPTRAQLNDLIHVRHLTYDEVAAHYGVDRSAISHWLDAAELPRPQSVGYRCATEIQTRYQSGDTAQTIADDLGCTRQVIYRALKRAEIPRRVRGWNGNTRYVTADGQEVRSSYERRVADWLIDHELPYVYEPPLPFADVHWRADFLVNNWYIEIWGIQKSSRYTEKQKAKRILYARYGLALIELNVSHFSARRRQGFERRMQTCTQRPAISSFATRQTDA